MRGALKSDARRPVTLALAFTIALGLAGSASAQQVSDQTIDYSGIFTFSTANGSVSCIGGFWAQHREDRSVGCTGANGLGASNSAACDLTRCFRENAYLGPEGYQARDPKAHGTVIGGGDLPFTCHIETELVQCIGPVGEFIVSRNGVFSIR